MLFSCSSLLDSICNKGTKEKCFTSIVLSTKSIGEPVSRQNLVGLFVGVYIILPSTSVDSVCCTVV
jgi:hypothetical protein